MTSLIFFWKNGTTVITDKTQLIGQSPVKDDCPIWIFGQIALSNGIGHHQSKMRVLFYKVAKNGKKV